MNALRVGIIGARRSRQGLGPYVARFLREAGAEVACFLATRSETLDAAGRELAERSGIEARGYLDLREMLWAEALDALAILSPAETHRDFLEAALDARLHVLCEKPFLWGVPEAVAATRRIVSGFEAGKLVLWEDCAWPYTLPAFEELHPGILRRTPTHFEMRLSPASAGRQMLGDAMPHVFSLLQAIAPAGSVCLEEIRFSTHRLDAPELTVDFRYAADARFVEAKVRLIQSKTQPREAGFGVNGCWARRLIRMEDYSILFANGPRIVDVPDPLGRLVYAFVQDLSSPSEPHGGSRARQIVQRMELLDTLTTAYEGGSH
jgi:hypothetical protein